MPDAIAIDTNNPYAAEILRDLAELKRSERAEHRVLLIKLMLENLASFEVRGCGLSPEAIRHLRLAVLSQA